MSNPKVIGIVISCSYLKINKVITIKHVKTFSIFMLGNKIKNCKTQFTYEVETTKRPDEIFQFYNNSGKREKLENIVDQEEFKNNNQLISEANKNYDIHIRQPSFLRPRKVSVSVKIYS